MNEALNKTGRVKAIGVWTLQVNDGPVEEFRNVVVNEGLDQMLGAMFDAATSKVNTWYIGVYDGVVTPAVTYTSAAGGGIGVVTSEVTTYDESARPAWDEGTPTDGTLAGSATATFTFNDTETIRGGFLTSAAAKDGSGDAAGTLFSCANFSSNKSVESGDVLNVGYTVTLANA